MRKMTTTEPAAGKYPMPHRMAHTLDHFHLQCASLGFENVLIFEKPEWQARKGSARRARNSQRRTAISFTGPNNSDSGTWPPTPRPSGAAPRHDRRRYG